MDKWRLYPLLGIAILIAGCGPTINAGHVEGKDYDPEWIYMQPVQTCSTDAKGNSTCSVSYYIPVTMPASWDIKVCGWDEDGEEGCQWWEVSESYYNEVQIGQYVERSK